MTPDRQPTVACPSGQSTTAIGVALPRLAFNSKAEVAEALGVSPDFVEDHVWPELKVVRRGRKGFVAVTELQGWLDQNAELTLGNRR